MYALRGGAIDAAVELFDHAFGVRLDALAVGKGDAGEVDERRRCLAQVASQRQHRLRCFFTCLGDFFAGGCRTLCRRCLLRGALLAFGLRHRRRPGLQQNAAENTGNRRHQGDAEAADQLLEAGLRFLCIDDQLDERVAHGTQGEQQPQIVEVVPGAAPVPSFVLVVVEAEPGDDDNGNDGGDGRGGHFAAEVGCQQPHADDQRQAADECDQQRFHGSGLQAQGQRTLRARHARPCLWARAVISAPARRPARRRIGSARSTSSSGRGFANAHPALGYAPSGTG